MKELPKTWDDIFIVDGYYTSDDSEVLTTCGKTTSDKIQNLFVTKEQAEASLALAQLSQLRKQYRQGWEPDWGSYEEWKYCIVFYDDKHYVDTFYTQHNFLSFQDMETATLFHNTFKDLIEQAKPLMS